MKPRNYLDLRSMAQTTLRRKLDSGALSAEVIREVVHKCAEVIDVADVDIEELVADLEASFQTLIGKERALQGKDGVWKPWLPERLAKTEFLFWNRYRQYLLEGGWPEPTLRRLDASTDRVLGLLGDPESLAEPWDRRGMVVGQVQSGKTANYVGLICKAADVGYKVIIVLAGFHRNLRSQTQVRLEEGFLGYDRSTMDPRDDAGAIPVGVGILDARPRANSITTRMDGGDFKKVVAKHFGISPSREPLLFVVKKNGSVLKNLLDWVKSAASQRDETGRRYVTGVPLLVVDDEADQGSIDTKRGSIDEFGQVDEEHDPTVINRRIRELLHLFDQSAYVGYTATPFANVFIHDAARTDRAGEDLFPRDFIVSIPSPSNHIGPRKVFGFTDESGEFVDGLPTVRQVMDHAASLDISERSGWIPPLHKKDHIPLVNGERMLPQSLREAVLAFVLACATRRARGDASEHCSMLVHVTRFTAVQNRVKEQLEAELVGIQRRLKLGDGTVSEPIRAQLRRLWEADFAPTTRAVADPSCPFIPWHEVNEHLLAAVTPIQVREINGHAGEVLDYVNHHEDGLKVIAVGGDKLSRGLTLEGLTISYFLRASRMYDTLMQMGRWFGYRPRYLDLCRLYTTPEMVEWFGHITEAAEELRQDFDRMAMSNATPKDFGLRVRSHPVMMVTSQVKMRHGTRIDVSFDGDICETVNFWRDRENLSRNWDAARRLLAETDAHPVAARESARESTYRGPWLWRGVRPETIVDFLEDYREHPASVRVKTQPLAEYIRKEVAEGRLREWCVFLASGNQNRTFEVDGAAFSPVKRSWFLNEQNEREKLAHQKANHFRVRRVLSPTDEASDLSSEERAQAMDMTIEQWRADGEVQNRPERPSGPSIRRVRAPERGLLVLYPIDPADGDEGRVAETGRVENDAFDIPILGFALSFPFVRSAIASRVQYVVNTVYHQQELDDLDIVDDPGDR